MDESKLNDFLGRLVADASAIWSAPLIVLGRELGLYDALARTGAVTAGELAELTGSDARMVAEWLANQVAGQIVEYDPDTDRFVLPPEHAFVLTDPASPADPISLVRAGMLVGEDLHTLAAAFSGTGQLAWDQHRPEFYTESDRIFAAGYRATLVSDWIPALDGAQTRLLRGATVADVGCGYGSSTIILAQAFPNSTFHGFDFHEPSIEQAKKAAADAGVADRVTFRVASATDYPGSGYDLVLYFDALHDVGDPGAALTHTRATLAPDGTVVLVEPYANEELGANVTPVGRLFSAGSTILCVPSSLAQGGEVALGNQVPERRWRDLATEAGYTRFRRVAQTPFNRVFEVRP